MSIKIENMIAEMRRKRLSSRYDKEQMIKPIQQATLNIYDNELIDDDIKEIIKAVKMESFPTIEILSKEIIDAIEMIYEHHNFGSSVLKHNCCFEVYFHKIIMLLKIMLSKEYLYVHKFGKEL